MLAIAADEATVAERLRGSRTASPSPVNGPAAVVISGAADLVEEVGAASPRRSPDSSAAGEPRVPLALMTRCWRSSGLSRRR